MSSVDKTKISREYLDKRIKDKEPYYPINKYKEPAEKDDKVRSCGRLWQYNINIATWIWQ